MEAFEPADAHAQPAWKRDMARQRTARERVDILQRLRRLRERKLEAAVRHAFDIRGSTIERFVWAACRPRGRYAEL